MSDREMRLTLSRGSVAAKAWGPPDGRPVLGLHGWLDNAGSYDLLAPELTDLRFIALDLPGHGLSDHHAPGHPYAFIDYVATIAEVLDVLRWSSCTLMGHSLGAGVSAVFAGTFPKRVDKLVLIEGLGPLTETSDGTPERLARALREEREKRDRKPPLYPSREDVLVRMQHAMRGLSREAAQCLVERSLLEVEGGVTWRTDPRLRWASRLRLHEAQVLAFLRRIAAPTLVVRATEGFQLPKDVATARLAALAKATVLELQGHHHVHLERPRELAKAVGHFLQT